MTRRIANNIDISGRYKHCPICNCERIFFYEHLHVCLDCAIRVPNHIPNEQVLKFLNVSKEK